MRPEFVRVTSLVVVLALSGCTSPPSQTQSTPSEAAEPSVDPLARTADPYQRGLSDEDFPRVKELAPGVFSYEQLRSAGDEKFATVSLFILSDEGVLVADGQGSPEQTQLLVDTIAEQTSAPITHVVICSDHGDHTAGNTSFPPDAIFYAHPNSEANLKASADDPRRAEDAPAIVLPTEIVERRKVLTLGGRDIEILFLGRAHTGGDLVVYLPTEKILFMSEAFLHRVFPAMRSAYPSEWLAMIESAQAMDVDIYVPGHGFVDSPEVLLAELEVFKQALARVMEEARKHHDAGLSADEAVQAAQFGDLETWSLRSSQAERAIRKVYEELDGELQ